MLPDRSSTIWIATPCVDVFTSPLVDCGLATAISIAPNATHRNASGIHRTRVRSDGPSRAASATLENTTAEPRVRRSRHHKSNGSPPSKINTQGIAK
jgi:P pilus assembly chaperone PapD